MSKADEMFKELGYKKVIPDVDKDVSNFKKNDEDYDELGVVEYIDFVKGNITITFNIWYKIIEINFEEKLMEFNLSMPELQAINEKCKELRVVR